MLKKPMREPLMALVLGALLSLHGPLQAKDAAAAPERADEQTSAQAAELSPLTVVARQPRAPGANAQTWTQADLERQPGMAMDDALRSLPSFSLFRRSSSRVANPTSQGVSLRGLASSGASRSLVLLDGLPLNDPFGGWVYWTRVAAPSDELRVTPGGLAHVWGSAALAGLIELHSANPQGLQGELISGSRDERRLRLAAGHQGEQLDWRLSAHDIEGGGYVPLAQAQRGAIDRVAEAEHRALDARVSWQGDSWQWRGGIHRFDEQRGNGTALTGNDSEILVVHAGARRSWQQQVLDWTLYWQDQRFASRFSSQAADRQSETPALDQFNVPSQAWGAALRWQQAQAECGLDARLIDGETNERFFYRDGDFTRQRLAGASQTLAGVYCRLFNQQPTAASQAADQDWTLSLSARLDYWSLRDARRYEFERSDGSVLRDERYPDRDDWSLSPRLDFARPFARGWGLRGALYGGLRAPTINELVRPFRVGNDITAANPALKAEQLNGIELGLIHQHEALQWQATVYYNEIRDAIGNVSVGEGPGSIDPCGFTPEGGSCRQRQNLDSLRGLGLELAAELSLSARWSVGVSTWWADTQVKTRGPSLDPAQVPDYRAVLSVTRQGRLQLFSQLSWIGSQFEDDLNQRKLNAYARWDASAAWRLGEQLQLYLAGENLLDERYAVGLSGNGLLSQGLPRSWHAGLRWRWAL